MLCSTNNAVITTNHFSAANLQMETTCQISKGISPEQSCIIKNEQNYSIHWAVCDINLCTHPWDSVGEATRSYNINSSTGIVEKWGHLSSWAAFVWSDHTVWKWLMCCECKSRQEVEGHKSWLITSGSHTYYFNMEQTGAVFLYPSRDMWRK